MEQDSWIDAKKSSNPVKRRRRWAEKAKIVEYNSAMEDLNERLIFDIVLFVEQFKAKKWKVVLWKIASNFYSYEPGGTFC